MMFLHVGENQTAQAPWTSWQWDPAIVSMLLLSGLLYLHGVRRARRAASRSVPATDVAAFLTGWLGLWLALVSPLHTLSEWLFSAHMTQHEILMLFAAPLLVLGRPLLPLIWALPKTWRRDAGETSRRPLIRKTWLVLTHPLGAWSIHAAALWVWHAPWLFEATLKSDFVHTLQHASFLGTALLFWWSLIHGGHGLMGYGAAALYVFTTSVHSSILGALLTFARTNWYPSYAITAPSLGWTALEDQQLGGIIMWVPASIVYLISGLALVAGWIRESERRVQQREQHAKGDLAPRR